MKKSNLTLIFLFITVTIFSQTTKAVSKKATLTINIRACRGIQNFHNLQTIKVFKDGNEFTLLTPAYDRKQVLNELEPGSYTLIYTSLFEQEENLNVEIGEAKDYSVELCTNFIDYSKETSLPIIDQLQDTESFTISISSRGCFHSSSEILKVERKKDIYTITRGSQSKILSREDLEAIRHFEIEARHIAPEGGCTTVDTYIIEYLDKEVTINDRTCSWNGGDYLKLKLFSNEE